ncbi:MAG: thiamine ABC transporter substrate-binding protein [Bdellovibrionia bacterium]
MKHAIFFISFIFAALFLSHLNRTQDGADVTNSKPVLRVFGYSSFTGKWGPGPLLKDEFEKTCNCQIEFIDGSDSGILLQRLKIEGESLGVDMIIGLDQFDLAKAQAEHSWRKIKTDGISFEPPIISFTKLDSFLPYDWGVMAFVSRKGGAPLTKLDDVVSEAWKGKIAFQDPRTSSPGMQFLSWIFDAKRENAEEYLQKVFSTAHSFSPTWSGSYGLFSKKQVDVVFSYVTSPLYHQIEEKDDNYMAHRFAEAHPIQVEFFGIPDFCKNCDLAENFAALLLSPQGQKIIMEKNYMFPVVQGIRQGTPFDIVENFPIQSQVPDINQQRVDEMIRTWSILRRGDKQR